MPTHNTDAYALEGVNCRLGGREILSDVSLRIPRGKLLALAGPNGAGKSTLLGVLSGDLRPSGGSLDFLGQQIGAWEPAPLARHRAVLLQANDVSFAFSVRQVVEMGRSPWWGRTSADTDERIIGNAVDRTETRHLLDRAYTTLSGGEKARVSLARVLAQNAEVVLLDEPTAALDLRHQEEVMALARELARSGRTVVVVVHDLALAAAYADDIALVDHGRLVAHGSPEDVLTPARIAEVYGIDVVVGRVEGQLVVLPRREPTRERSHGFSITNTDVHNSTQPSSEGIR